MGGRRITRGAAIRSSPLAFRSHDSAPVPGIWILNDAKGETWLRSRCKKPSHVDDTEILSRGGESACERARWLLAALSLPSAPTGAKPARRGTCPLLLSRTQFIVVESV